MSSLTKKYLDGYIVCYALYAFFNKGIAYSFLAELLLIVGLIIVLFRFKELEIPKTSIVLLLLLFLFVNLLFIGRGIMSYPLIEVIRDSFILNYGLFVFIIFFFRNYTNYLLSGIYKVYAILPIVQTIHFLILSYVPHADELVLFGNMSLLHYKYGDLAVHLFIGLILLLTGKIVLQRRFAILHILLTGYLFLIASSYSRAGMLCFIITGILFYVTLKDRQLKGQLRYYSRFVPIFLLIAIPLYQLTKTKENFQGRTTGMAQLTENVVSIVSTEKGSTQSNNNVWRLVWWGKIIDYTFAGPYFIAGKGLGMSLAVDDDIDPATEGELRSPHNFHLNILARYGVPFFCVWLLWIFLHLKRLKNSSLSSDSQLLLCIFCIFILNASFDVYLEGPMGAFAFWTFTGFLYNHLFFKEEEKVAPIV